MKTRCVSSVSVRGTAPITPAALRRPAEAPAEQSNPPSPFLFGLLFLLGDSKRKSYCSLFYYYLYSLIYILHSFFINLLCSLRGIRQPAYMLADSVAFQRPFVARNPLACIFASGFRSAQGIGARRSGAQRRTFAMNAESPVRP